MIDSATFNNLKARVKAECQRRKYTGSVASYAGTAYDFTNPAAAGKLIMYEHYEKNAVPLTAIDGKTRIPRTRINQSDITEMQTSLTALEKISLTSTSTGCSASCTGLCYSGCAGTCKNQCGDQCTGCTGCGNGCAYWCGGCGSTCSGTCTGGCTSCTGSCSTTCLGGCSGGCGNNCTGTTSVFS